MSLLTQPRLSKTYGGDIAAFARAAGLPRRNGDPRPETAEQEIPLSAIADSPFQVRRDFGDLEGLTNSLVADGLLQAIVVRPKPAKAGTPAAGTPAYELLAGHRRCAAARAAGWKTIRARIMEADDQKAEEIVVIENLMREDLNEIEEARGFEAMLRRPGMTETELAKRLHVSQPHVANRLRMLKAPKPFQEAVISAKYPPAT